MKMGNQNIEQSFSRKDGAEEGDDETFSRSYATLLRFQSTHRTDSELDLDGQSASPQRSRPSSTQQSAHPRSGSIAGTNGTDTRRVEAGGDASNYRISNATGILAGGINSAPVTRPGTPNGGPRVGFVIPEST